MSDYRPDSELMKLCAAPPGVPRLTSDDLFRVLVASQQVSQASDGAFDVSAGPLVALWREARRTGQLPFGESIAQAKEHVGWEDIELESKTACVTLKKPGMKLDLGGIAKGYAAQQAVETLQNLGCERCLVGLAGDLCVGDPPPGEKGWTIDVAPAPGRSTHARSLLLKNMSISTSGDSEQFVEIGGRRYSHIVDPRTGMATTTRVQATVISRSGEKADALATAICVLGPAKGGGLARQMSVAAIVNEPDSPEVIINEERLRWEKP
jgi:thiamine biosynthesis lipoprotein